MSSICVRLPAAIRESSYLIVNLINRSADMLLGCPSFELWTDHGGH